MAAREPTLCTIPAISCMCTSMHADHAYAGIDSVFCFETNCRCRANEGFEYATYNDAEDLKRVVKRINRRSKIRALFGRPRRAVAAIMMEALQVSPSVRPPTARATNNGAWPALFSTAVS